MKPIIPFLFTLLFAMSASAQTATLVPFGQNQTRTETQAGPTVLGDETNALNFLLPYSNTIAAFGNIGMTQVDWGATTGFQHDFDLTRTTSGAGNRVSSTGKGDFTVDSDFCFVVTGQLDVTNTDPGTTLISASIGTPGDPTGLYDHTVTEVDVVDTSVSLPAQSICVTGGAYVFDFEMTNEGGAQVGNANGTGHLDIRIVPEPTTYASLGSGCGLLALLRRRRA